MNAPQITEPVPSRRTLGPVIGLLAIIVVPALLFVLFRFSFITDPLPVGEHVPHPFLRTIDGGSVRAEKQMGQKRMLLFFSTTCEHCRNLLHTLTIVSHRSAVPLPVIAVAGETALAVCAFQEEQRLSFTILLDSAHRTRDLFRVRMLPTLFFIDSGGILRRMVTGELSEERLTELVDEYFNPSSSDTVHAQ